MPEEYMDRFLEVLNNTFSACDLDGSGFVEINRLIDFLISQEPSWLDNQTIREEFHKILHSDLNNVISKENFINTLQGWFETVYEEHNVDKEKNVNREVGKRSNSTSGVGECSEMTSGSSSNSMEEIYSRANFVTDEETFTNENLTEESSLNDSGSSQTDLRLVKVHKSEISTLLRKNEYLENLNDSLLGQVSSLEDTLSKKKFESEDYKNQLVKCNILLESQMQKQEETVEKINIITEEKKSMAIQISQFERENKKLKTIVSRLEEKLESSISENAEITTKLEEMTNKANTMNDLYNNSLKLLSQEREHFNIKEVDWENTLKEIITENRNFQSQLDANHSYTEDIKCKLRTALKELSEFQNERVKNIVETGDSVCSLPTSEKSMVLLGENFPLDQTIPFEASLLAELKDEVESDKQDCCCVCKQNVSLNTRSSDLVDAAVATNTIEGVDKATMTASCKQGERDFYTNNGYEDISIECSAPKTPQILRNGKSGLLCLMKYRRSVKKWASLFGVIFVLSFLLVFFFVQILLLPNAKYSHKSTYYFGTIFDIMLVQVKVLDLLLPIK